MLKLKNFIETKYGRTLPEIIANNSDNILLLKEAYESLTGDLISDEDFQNILATLFNNLWYTNKPEFIAQVRAILSSELEKRLETVPDELIANTEFITKVADLVAGEFATKTDLDELKESTNQLFTTATTWTNILAKEDRPTTYIEFAKYVFAHKNQKEYKLIISGNTSDGTDGMIDDIHINSPSFDGDGLFYFNKMYGSYVNTNNNDFPLYIYQFYYNDQARCCYLKISELYFSSNGVNLEVPVDFKIATFPSSDHFEIPATSKNVMKKPLNIYIFERDMVTPDYKYPTT